MARPDFICVGPPKTATTWLFALFKKHPEVWVPPVKEVQYFWGFGKHNNLPTNLIRKISRVLFGYTNKRWKKRYFKERYLLYKSYPKMIWTKYFLWDLFYIFFPPSPFWYKCLFPSRDNIITGDLSPTYSMMTSRQIKRIAKHYPNLKIIITLRDPIERVWSDVKMDLSYRNVSLNADILIDTIERLSKRYDYTKIVSEWQMEFGSSQVKYFYYDKLVESPEHYFKDICDFLEIESAQLLRDPLIHSRVFESGVNASVPEEVKELLIKENIDSLKEWANYSSDSYALKWKQKYEDY